VKNKGEVDNTGVGPPPPPFATEGASFLAHDKRVRLLRRYNFDTCTEPTRPAKDHRRMSSRRLMSGENLKAQTVGLTDKKLGYPVNEDRAAAQGQLVVHKSMLQYAAA